MGTKPTLETLEAHGLLKGSAWNGYSGVVMTVKSRWCDPVTMVSSSIDFTDGKRIIKVNSDQVLEWIESGKLKPVRIVSMLES